MPDIGALTGLTEPELASWLAEMRKATALSGEAALEACDTLLWSWSEWLSRRGDPPAVPDEPTLSDADYRASLLAEDIDRLRATMTRLRRSLAIAGALQSWDGDTLLRESDNVGHLAGQAARESRAGEITALREEAGALSREMATAVQRHALTLAGERTIIGLSTIGSIVGAVNHALRQLTEIGALSPEDEAAGLAAKTRSARYRCDKRLAEAEVIAAGGNITRAEKMRAEAGVMLRQDMSKCGLAIDTTTLSQ